MENKRKLRYEEKKAIMNNKTSCKVTLPKRVYGKKVLVVYIDEEIEDEKGEWDN